MPKAINVSAQLDENAIVSPHIRAEKFWTLNPRIVDVNPWIILQSTFNLAVRVPALFSGMSKYGIGILNNFWNVSILNLVVNLSAQTFKQKFSIVVNNQYPIPSKKKIKPILSDSSYTSCIFCCFSYSK